MWLIRSERYCFEMGTQKIVLCCLYISRTNYVRLNILTIQKTTKAKLSQFVSYIEAIIYFFVVVLSTLLL